MKKVFLCFFILIIFNNIFLLKSQNYISVRGVVKEQNTEKVLAFASISIQNQYIGTLSNEKGQFIFKFLEKFKNDTLNISYMGYEQLKKPINELNFKDRKFNFFYLKKSSIELESITIKNKRITAREIVNKAVKKIPDNYYTKEHLMEAYFFSKNDEFFKKDHKYYKDLGRSLEKMRTEAAVKIYTPKYKKIHGSSKIDENFEILGIKKENDFNSKLSFPFLSIYGNQLKPTMTNNIFRYHTFRANFLKKRKNKIYDFKIKSKFTYNDDLIYKIFFSRKKDRTSFFGSTKTKIYGDIYIRQKDYAIIGIEYFRDSQSKFDNFLAQKKIEYKDYKGKLFLSYISYNYVIKSKDTTEYRTLSDLVKGSDQLLINRIYIENFKKIEKNEKDFDKNLNLQEKLKYDPEFWENYNYIIDTLSIQEKDFNFKK